MRSHHRSLGGLLLCVVVWNAIALLARSNDVYPSFDTAMSAAAKFMKDRDYKAAQAPLEAALRMAPGDAKRLRIYNNLTACYRLLPETERMTEACEFTIAHTKEDAERSLTARSLTSFMFQRGKLDETRKAYEERLAKTPDDLVALAMLTAISGVNPKDRDKAKGYQAKLDKVEQQRSSKLAEEEEGLAVAEPAQATSHWKQAAIYRIRAAEPAKALADAKQAESTGPDKRTELLQYFWHSQLGDVYLAANSPQDAIRHFEQAIATTKIAGHKESCQKKIAEAKSKLGDNP